MAAQSAAANYRYKHLSMDVLRHDFKFESGPGPGEAMPDLDMLTTDQTRLTTRSWVGRQPVLLVFGSVSCPMTATSMGALTRLYSEFGNNVVFVMLNVREAHPGEGIPQPDSLEEKLEHAVALKERYDIRWTVATDSAEGTIHRALDPKPNAAYLMDVEGRIAYRSLWAGDERGLRQALDKVSKGETPTERESERKLVPMTAGIGEMRETLERAGPSARRDLWRSAAPMAMMAWLAGMFRPLPPVVRGFVAMGVTMVIVVAVLAGLVAWIV